MYEDLSEKRVLITGGAAGIGLAITLAFARAGARVHICDINANAVREQVENNSAISGTVADVADEKQVEKFISEGLDQLGGVDFLINNAGIAGPAGVLEDLDSQAWRTTFDVNIHSTFYCCKNVLPVMKQAKFGAIINLSSTAGIFGYPLRTPYASAKWAVTGLTHSLAIEAGEYGVRVNAVCPGSVSGERMDRVIANEANARGLSEDEVRESFLNQCSLRTFVSPEDVAAVILFLCSDVGVKISGQIIPVDGNTHSLAFM